MEYNVYFLVDLYTVGELLWDYEYFLKGQIILTCQVSFLGGVPGLKCTQWTQVLRHQDLVYYETVREVEDFFADCSYFSSFVLLV